MLEVLELMLLLLRPVLFLLKLILPFQLVVLGGGEQTGSGSGSSSR
jgi:hypothetical protein